MNPSLLFRASQILSVFIGFSSCSPKKYRRLTVLGRLCKMQFASHRMKTLRNNAAPAALILPDSQLPLNPSLQIWSPPGWRGSEVFYCCSARGRAGNDAGGGMARTWAGMKALVTALLAVALDMELLTTSSKLHESSTSRLGGCVQAAAMTATTFSEFCATALSFRQSPERLSDYNYRAWLGQGPNVPQLRGQRWSCLQRDVSAVLQRQEPRGASEATQGKQCC